MIGGLAAVNAEKGKIVDCYTVWNNNNNKNNRALVSQNGGIVQSAALIYKGECESIYDVRGQQSLDYRVNKTSDIKKLGFNTESIWEYAGGRALLRFKSAFWHANSSASNSGSVIHIRNAKDFLSFADKVNAGNASAIRATVYLDNDIDFHGKTIPVIGYKRENAFCGVFDGRGHLMWNGTVRNDEAVYAALFGYLKGRIINLLFDCRISGEKNLGGLCGINQGEVNSCGVLVRQKEKDDRGNIGGIVTVNEGRLVKCYSVFEPKKAVSPVILIAILAIGLIGLGSLGYTTVSAALEVNKEFATMEVDPGQQKVENTASAIEKSEEDPVEANVNTMAFTFNERVIVSRSNGTCKLDFINREDNPNKLVALLQIENEFGERETVASSKAVLPGYGLEFLTAEDDGILKLGNLASGTIVLIPYDIKTENMGMIKTELPVTLVYED